MNELLLGHQGVKGGGNREGEADCGILPDAQLICFSLLRPNVDAGPARNRGKIHRHLSGEHSKSEGEV